MELESLKDLAPVVSVVALFLLFLWKFGSKALDAANNVSEAMNALTVMIRQESEEAKKQTELLRKLCTSHGEINGTTKRIETKVDDILKSGHP